MLKVKKQKINPKQMLADHRTKAEKELEEDGIVTFDLISGRLNIADDYLVLPQNITEVPSRSLGEHLNAFTQQRVYVRTLIGRIEILVDEARREYIERSDPLYRQYSDNKKLSETAKERILNAEPSVKPSYEIFLDAKNKLRVAQYNLESIENIIFLLSREVSRRGDDFKDESRNHNLGR